jgi:hypothetical protein
MGLPEIGTDCLQTELGNRRAKAAKGIVGGC